MTVKRASPGISYFGIFSELTGDSFPESHDILSLSVSQPVAEEVFPVVGKRTYHRDSSYISQRQCKSGVVFE